MNNTQNKKITQVTDDTLIVGVDIGSESHWARAILARGYEVSKKPFHFDPKSRIIRTQNVKWDVI